MKLLRIIPFLLATSLLAQFSPRETLQRSVGTNLVTGTQAQVPLQVESIAVLKAITVANVANGQVVRALGYYVAGDDGGGVFTYNSASATTADNGAVIAPNAGSGRWLRDMTTGPPTVRIFGAKGDAVTDDTAALQAGITYAGTVGGTIVVPHGTFVYSSLTINAGCTVQGNGWNISQISASFGGVVWGTAEGSILRSTVTTGKSITVGSVDLVAVINLRDIAIVGPGTGTSVGIAIGPQTGTPVGIVDSCWINVLVGNFYTGIEGSWVEQCSFKLLVLQGCRVGYDVITVDHNANTFTGISVMGCLDVGVRFSAQGGCNLFSGGACQSMGVDGFVLLGISNTIQGMWFENTDATGDDVRFTDGTGNCAVLNCGNFKRPIRLAGASTYGNIIANNWANAGVAPQLIAEAAVTQVNIVRDNQNFAVVDTGGALCRTFSLGKQTTASVDSGSPVTLTSGVSANVVSLELAAFTEYDLDITLYFLPAGGPTGTVYGVGISATSATLPGSSGFAQNVQVGDLTLGGISVPLQVNRVRVRTGASPVTYYAVANCTFSGGTNMKAYGILRATIAR